LQNIFLYNTIIELISKSFRSIREGILINNRDNISSPIAADQILEFLIKSGAINMDTVQKNMTEMKNQEILHLHEYQIWQGKDGKWRTYLPDEIKGRRQIKRVTEEKINDAIIEFYKKREDGENSSTSILFKDVYKRWLKSREVTFTSPNTVIKYNSDYLRFFQGKPFETMPVTELHEENITEFIITTVREQKLSKKACKTLCGYVRNTLKSARIHKDIKENPFDNLEAKSFYPYCTVKIKTAAERTVSPQQFKLLYERFELDYKKQPQYIPTYAVEFASLTGLRVSELSALEWSDIQDGVITISKSEKYNRNTKERTIEETKNKKIRYMPITEEIVSLLNRVWNVEKEYGYLGNYIFMNENGRIHSGKISDCARNKCKQIGIPNKSIHAYRRTFSSKLKCNGMSSAVVSALMGHTEEVNEQYYTYDITSIQEKQQMVSMVTKEISLSRQHPKS